MNGASPPGQMHATIALCVVVIANVCANLLLKLGSREVANAWKLFGIVRAETLAGGVCFALALVVYAWALRHFDLNVAQVVASLQFVFVIICAAVVLGEPISLQRWGGIALVALGVFIALRT